MRRPHLLSRNHGGEGPVRVLVMDTETREEIQDNGDKLHRLTFGWAWYHRRHTGQQWSAGEWARFDTVEGFWRIVLDKVPAGTRLDVYCHNAAFDCAVVNAFDWLERDGWEVTKACLEGPPTIIQWRKDRRTIRWLDTLNYWPMKLAEIGERVGLKKLSMGAWGSTGARADAYCRRDIRILWKALREWWQFIQDHDLGTISPTIASQAMSAYRHRFMDHPIFIDTNPDALKLARSSYLGGRVECSRLGRVEGPIISLDINSNYIYVMRDLEAPTKLLTFTGSMKPDRLRRYLEQYACCALVAIQTEQPIYPVKLDGRLCFPVGKFDAALASPELIRALERGHVRHVYNVAIYERAVIFTGFCDWVWRERRAVKAKGSNVVEWHIKRLGNSLYGKWGQRGIIWVETEARLPGVTADLSSYDLDTKTMRRMRAIGGTIQVRKDDSESFNSHPAIAAHVCSGARLLLWDMEVAAGRENVLYKDTDCLKVLPAGLSALFERVNPDALGGLKVESVKPWIEINGCKDYKTPGDVRLKGVRPDAFMFGESIRLTEQWSNWRGLLERGDLSAPVVKPWIKSLAREYTKGDVQADGSILPLRL